MLLFICMSCYCFYIVWCSQHTVCLYPTYLCRLAGLVGYFRRGLIDAGSAKPFILASLPACLLGAVIVPYADERVLKALYAVFMLGLSVYLLTDEDG